MKNKFKQKISNFLLKVFNRKEYLEMKRRRSSQENFKVSNKFERYNATGYFRFCKQAPIASFKHSGHTGDVIYSLPTIRELSVKARIYLNTGMGGYLPSDVIHPYGTNSLPLEAIEKLVPLLESQSYIEFVSVYQGEHVDYDLDLMREIPLRLDAGILSNHYFPIFGVSPDISLPWLCTSKNEVLKDYIIVARSNRYRNESLNYSFINQYSDIGFVGIESEYAELKKIVPKLEYFPVKDFRELAEIINSCRLFIGNQSFPYSLAEAMKVTRVLEVCPYAPNVVPIGGVGHSIFFQKQFEYVVHTLLGNTPLYIGNARS